MLLGIGHWLLVLLLTIVVGHKVSGIWFHWIHDVSFLPFVFRDTGVGTLGGHKLWGSWRIIMRCQDGSILVEITRGSGFISLMCFFRVC